MTSFVVGDWKREDGRGSKGSPEGFPSGGGLGVSPSLIKVPQDWGIRGLILWPSELVSESQGKYTETRDAEINSA